MLDEEISLHLCPGEYKDINPLLEIEISGIRVELNDLISIDKGQIHYSYSEGGNEYKY